MDKMFWKNVVWENDRLIYKRKTNREVTKGRRKKKQKPMKLNHLNI